MVGALGPVFAGPLDGEDWSDLRDADVIVFGEVHDNPIHHANQARAVSALKPEALVFEQLTPELARKVSPELIADAVKLEMALEWEDRGWPDFAAYYPIFAAAEDAAIFGGGAPHDDVRKAVSVGAAEVFGEGGGIFGLDRPFADEVQVDLEATQQLAHCNALPTEMLPGMVEAQRLRDAVLARATLAAYHESVTRKGGGPVIVITGNGHAQNDWAVPAMLRLAMPEIAVRSVGQFEDAAPEAPEFDHWLVTEATEREDPCAVFRD